MDEATRLHAVALCDDIQERAERAHDTVAKALAEIIRIFERARDEMKKESTS